MILRQPDWCSPWGITRPDCPPDDEHTDALAALAAAVEHAYLDLQLAGPDLDHRDRDPRQRTEALAGRTPIAGHGALPVPAIPADDFPTSTGRSPTRPSAGRSDAGVAPPPGRPLHHLNHTTTRKHHQ